MMTGAYPKIIGIIKLSRFRFATYHLGIEQGSVLTVVNIRGRKNVGRFFRFGLYHKIIINYSIR